ncbi:MAG: BON domain-containing protein [Chloroflexi bacterium]|nr:BON domain-containing protein [Chloroflexota bacterium]
MKSSYLPEAIREAIALNPEIRSEIDVELEGELVRLTGVVSSPEERELAEKVAFSGGACFVENNIAVEMGERSNIQLQIAVTEALNREDLSGIAGVEKVLNGIVYLAGHARSANEAQRAIQTAAGTPGARDVVSHIALSPEATTESTTLVNRVEQALSEAGIVVKNVGARASNGMVYLEGVVPRALDKESAAAIAKTVAGVRGVVNKLHASTEPLSRDEEIESAVLRRLEAAKINVINLSVVVTSGTAFLDGTVDSERQKDLASEIVLRTPGIMGIENNLAVAAAS